MINKDKCKVVTGFLTKLSEYDIKTSVVFTKDQKKIEIIR